MADALPLSYVRVSGADNPTASAHPARSGWSLYKVASAKNRLPVATRNPNAQPITPLVSPIRAPYSCAARVTNVAATNPKQRIPTASIKTTVGIVQRDGGPSIPTTSCRDRISDVATTSYGASRWPTVSPTRRVAVRGTCAHYRSDSKGCRGDCRMTHARVRSDSSSGQSLREERPKASRSNGWSCVHFTP